MPSDRPRITSKATIVWQVALWAAVSICLAIRRRDDAPRLRGSEVKKPGLSERTAKTVELRRELSENACYGIDLILVYALGVVHYANKRLDF